MREGALLTIVCLSAALGCARARPAPEARETETGAGDAGAAEAGPAVTLVFIDLARAVAETQEGARGKRALSALFEQHKRALDEEQAALRQEVEAAEKKLVGVPRAEAAAAHEALKRRLDDLARRPGDYEEDLRLREKAIYIPILERMRKVVAAMARKEGYVVTFEARDDVPDLTAAAVAAYDKAR